MTRHPLIYSLLFFAAALTAGCSDTDDDAGYDGSAEAKAEQTVIMFFPYCGSLLSAFNNNISDMAAAVESRGGLGDQRLVVYICQSATTAHLIEIIHDGDGVVRDTICIDTFAEAPYTTVEGMAGLLGRIESAAPAESYAIVIGCHGMGWLPVGTTVSGTSSAKSLNLTEEEAIATRYFGHTTDATWQCDISTLAQGITATGQPMDYILFDACYMANIETAYELRSATSMLIASPTEVMSAGVPYSVAGSYLLDNDLQGFCDAFADYYLSTSTPYASMSVIDCSKVEAMADVMSGLHAVAGTDADAATLQAFDGLSPHLFYDLGDYAETLCSGDTEWLNNIDATMADLVPYSRHTPSFYSAYDNSVTTISTFSGLTISAPSDNDAASSWRQTAWGQRTIGES